MIPRLRGDWPTWRHGASARRRAPFIPRVCGRHWRGTVMGVLLSQALHAARAQHAFAGDAALR